MAYPVLASNSTWFSQGGTTVKRASITEIEILDKYIPDASITVVSSWDASADRNGSIICYVIGTKLIIAGNGSDKIAVGADASYLFCDIDYKDLFENVVSINGLELIDTSNAVKLNAAFNALRKVTNLNVQNWNVENVTTLRSMCTNANALIAFNAPNWNVSKVSDIAFMFNGCKAIKTINVSNWDVRKVITMDRSFANCSVLESIDVSNWKTDSLTNILGIFMNDTNLKNVNMYGWNVSKVTNMTGAFLSCKSLVSVDLSLWDVHSVTSMTEMFCSCTKLTSVGNISNWDVSSCTSMPDMFSYCNSLSQLDISNWDVSSCTNMCGMFDNSNKLSELDVSNWDVSNVTDMSFMFYSCSSLKEIDVSNWDVSKVTNFDHFAAHANLKRKGIENWKPVSATNMNALFHNCAEEELDLTGWDVSKNQFFCQMFENSPNLRRIKGLEKWNTSAGLGFDGMFERCSKLEELDLSSFDTTKAKNGTSASTNGHKTATLQNMFLSCNNLKKITVGPNFSINGNGSNTTAGNKAILPTPSTDYIEGADGNWYTFTGDVHAPNAMKDKTAETYYASYNMVADVDVIVKNGSLIDTAKAIREKNGSTDKYTPAQFGAAIRALT